jgi:hypothetical protein
MDPRRNGPTKYSSHQFFELRFLPIDSKNQRFEKITTTKQNLKNSINHFQNVLKSSTTLYASPKQIIFFFTIHLFAGRASFAKNRDEKLLATMNSN